MLRSTSNSQQIGCVGEVCHIKGILYFDDLYVTGFRLIMILLEECDILRSKPTVGSVCGGVFRILPFIKLMVYRVTYKRP